MPAVYSLKGSIPHKVSILLLAGLIMLSMASVVIAQTTLLSQSPPTAQEVRILNKHYALKSMKNYDHGASVDFFQELEHYMRDGCKKKLTGSWWIWQPWGDVVVISYDENHKVFLGKVARSVKMDVQPDHVLFKVYFTKDNRGFKLPGNIDINWLRLQQQCSNWGFEGTEYSFEQWTKKKTEQKLWLILENDRLIYRLEKKSWYLNPTRRPAGPND